MSKSRNQDELAHYLGDCCICLSSMNASSLGRQTLTCGHMFHEKCVKELRRYGESGECPLCRVRLEELTPIQHMFTDAVMKKLRGQYQECFQTLSQILDVDPKHGLANYSMAEFFDFGILGVQQDHDRAAEFYEAARIAGVGHVENNLGQIYKKQGKREEAKKLFSEVCHSDPLAAFNLAVMSKEDGNLEQAEKLYLMAHRHGLANATYNLANLYLMRGQCQSAKQLYLQLIHHLPHDGTLELDNEAYRQHFIGCAMLNLGNLYKQQEEWTQARDMLLSAHHMGATGAFQNLGGLILTVMIKYGRKNMCGIVNWIMEVSEGDQELLLQSFEKGQKQANEVSLEGSLVSIGGLQSAVGQPLNGLEGIVFGYDHTTGRFKVAIKGVGNKLIKASNVRTVLSNPSRLSMGASAAAASGGLSFTRAHEDDDYQMGLQASLQHSSENAAEHDAPLMDAIMRSKSLPDTTTATILEYSKNHEWFRRVLLEGPELEERRKELIDAGFDPELKSGAKCFVCPGIFEAVVQTLCKQGIETDKRHVIVSADIEDIVKRAVENGRKSLSRRERGSFKMKGRSEMDIPLAPEKHEAPEHSDQPLILTKRTFIHVKLPSSMRSTSSVCAATW